MITTQLIQAKKSFVAAAFVAADVRRRTPMILAAALLTVFVCVGCRSASEHEHSHATTSAAEKPPSTSAAPSAPAAAQAPAAPAAPAGAPATATAAAASFKPIRIKAGLDTSIKDVEGNTWLPDQGFTGGDTVQRPDLEIANTRSPDIYRAERYSMTAFSQSVPNGKYVVKLHFAETFEGIMGPGERVFSFNVEGQDFKDFDVWVKTGGARRAYVETVNVEIKDGKLDITFTPNVENPEINGIEILPPS